MKVNCATCGVEFNKKDWFVRNSKSGLFYCSKPCAIESRRTTVAVDCAACGKSFSVRAYRASTAHFCSYACKRTGKIFNCDTCGAEVYRAPSHVKGNVFCSNECAAVHTRFQEGASPWNKGVTGIRLSPETEFKPGPRPENRASIGTVSIRTDKHGASRAHVKIGHPTKWLLRSRLVWMTHNGPIARKLVVHHKDLDTLNDAIENLELVTMAEHLNIHRSAFNRPKHRKSRFQETLT